LKSVKFVYFISLHWKAYNSLFPDRWKKLKFSVFWSFWIQKQTHKFISIEQNHIQWAKNIIEQPGYDNNLKIKIS
jgi:hypothetical protein